MSFLSRKLRTAFTTTALRKEEGRTAQQIVAVLRAVTLMQYDALMSILHQTVRTFPEATETIVTLFVRVGYERNPEPKPRSCNMPKSLSGLH